MVYWSQGNVPGQSQGPAGNLGGRGARGEGRRTAAGRLGSVAPLPGGFCSGNLGPGDAASPP